MKRYNLAFVEISASDIELMEGFFGQLKTKEQELILRKTESDFAFIQPFINEFPHVEKKARDILRYSSPHYNVFDVLNIGRYETKLHTPFLYNLLNPDGSHGQGRCFLDTLFNLIYGENIDLSDFGYFDVQEELSNYYGRIDIYIGYQFRSERRAVVIENKIGAQDQPMQLERYIKFLNSMMGLNDSQFHVIYLTPKGKGPQLEKAINPKTYKRFSSIGRLLEWSYRKDITEWISKSEFKIQSDAVKETVRQYKILIQNL